MGEYTRKAIKWKDLRLSLLSLGSGPYKFYVLTTHNKALALFKVLKREDYIRANYDNNKEKANQYADLLKDISNKDKEMVKEFIQHQIQDRQAVLSSNSNKIGIYSAISVMIITIIATYTNFSFSCLPLLQKIIIFILAYNLLNMIAYTIFSLSVQEVRRASINTIIESKNIVNEVIASLYYDSICLKDENRVRISTILDIERYLRYFIIFIIAYILIGL